MDHDEYADEAIFDDLYDDEPPKAASAAPNKSTAQPQQKPTVTAIQSSEPTTSNIQTEYTPAEPQQNFQQGNVDYSGYNMNQDYSQDQGYGNEGMNDWSQGQQNNGYGKGFYGDGSGVDGSNFHGGSGDGSSTAIKEDGKMFIGGLNWETTDESLRDYFSQFGEVSECTVMRDGPSGRSRGFGFLTFKDPKTVNIVMVKEHYLDGKIIDPKRAIPRDEQERTSKIFVGGVSQEATEQDFREYFAQFGRIVDATLMIDKETGRPRGFGFVTFDNEAAVDAALAHPDLRIHDKPIEVKKAQPRGNARERNFEDDGGAGGGGNRHNNFRDRGGHHNNNNNRFNQNRDQSQGGQDSSNFNNQQNNPQNMQNQMAQGGNQPGGFMNGMSPAMLAQYWQRMQQYWMMMMQQQAQMNNMRGGQGGSQQGMMPNMGNFNPQMMQQMQQMQGMQGMPNMQSMPNMQPGMNPMGMNGMGGQQGQGQGFMSPQGGQFQPKSPNMQMQQPFNAGDNSSPSGQENPKSGGSSGGQSDQNQMGQMGQQNQMWNNNNNGMFGDDGNSQGGNDGQGNRGMHGGYQNKQNFQAPTGPKAGTGGPPPNAPTGPRSARNTAGGVAGGNAGGNQGGGQGPYRNQGRGNYQGRGFHPYQRN